MRILADENIAGSIVRALRSAGHDVEWVRLSAPGISDEAVLARARAAGRTLVTLDTDFGRLVYHDRLPASPGIVLARFPSSSHWPTVADLVVGLLSRGEDWEALFVVIDAHRVRITRLPES